MKNYSTSRFVIIAISVLTLSLLTLFYRSDSASTKSNSVMVAPTLSATKTAALDTTARGDLNGNGLVNPGDRLTHFSAAQLVPVFRCFNYSRGLCSEFPDA